MWKNFISLSEEDQQTILEGVEDVDGIDDELDDEFEFLDKVEEDCRNLHPAYHPSEAFKCIDPKLKPLLKQRNLPIVSEYSLNI